MRIVRGMGDTIFSQDDATYLDRTLPRSQAVRWIEGAKLFLAEEFPGVIAEEARKPWAA